MSTKLRPPHYPIAVLKLPEYEVTRLQTMARAMVLAMTDNPHFPSPEPDLATVDAAIDALAAAETTVLTRVYGSVAIRDDKRKALVVLLQQLRNHVQATANADAEHGVSIIESAGMSVKRPRVLPGRVFAASRGEVSGSVKLTAPRAGERASYEWAYSIDAMRTWISVPNTVRSTTTIYGLPRGSTVHFRYRATTKEGVGDWSEPVALIVD